MAGNTVLATETGIDVALAAPTVADNDVRDARVAVALLDGTAGTLSGNRISGNEVGIRVDNAWLTTGSPSEVVLGDNDVCDNDVDLEIAPDAAVRQDGDGMLHRQPARDPAAPDPYPSRRSWPGSRRSSRRDGVVRARADGAGHELAGSQLVASNDAGDIWVFRGESELFQLGRPGTESIEHTAPYPWAMAVAEDGSVWLSTSGGIFSFDGSTWTGHQVFTDGVSRIDAARDGSVWVTWAPWDDASGPHLTVGRYDDGGWTTWESGADDGSFPVARPVPFRLRGHARRTRLALLLRTRGARPRRLRR